MSFEVRDFGEFLTILRAHPEWQAELRHILIGDELAEIRIAIEKSRAEFAASIAAVEAQLRELSEQSASAGQRLSKVETDLAYLTGLTNESWYRHRAGGIFGHMLRRVRVISFADLDDIRRARTTGTIDQGEWNDLTSLDLLVRGMDDEGHLLLVAFEVAWKLDEGDIIRAARRAATIRKSGLRCVAAIGGGDVPVHEGVLLAARHAGVAVLREGAVLYWPESGAA